MRTYTHTFTHTHIHTYVHTHTHSLQEHNVPEKTWKHYTQVTTCRRPRSLPHTHAHWQHASSPLRPTRRRWSVCSTRLYVWHCVAACCSVLQRVAACSSVRWCVAVCCCVFLCVPPLRTTRWRWSMCNRPMYLWHVYIHINVRYTYMYIYMYILLRGMVSLPLRPMRPRWWVCRVLQCVAVYFAGSCIVLQYLPPPPLRPMRPRWSVCRVLQCVLQCVVVCFSVCCLYARRVQDDQSAVCRSVCHSVL